MSYVVLARKWRPGRFEDLVGQEHVARTLGNAIKSGRIAHAFLFTGVRGVGKTTSARILAKALNCMGDPERPDPTIDPGPTVSPCLKCPACLEITAGSDVDVREIDGASYNGVDEVRKLQDSLPYRPSRDRYKIIIVDEVHMLTQAAWNAFLKTLEEPPPHVKFIFATTEVHKVPITILSRVQRFDFKMISVRAISARLRYVLAEENIQADDASVGLIARQAAGSMRDGMSLLDQVIAFGGGRLEGDEVARVLGVAGHGAILAICQAVISGDSARCLTLLAEVFEQGFDMSHLARDLLGVLRDLVVAKVAQDKTGLLDLTQEEQVEVEALAASTSEADLLRLHQGFASQFDEISRAQDPRSNLEMLLIRLSRRPPLLPIDELLHRISLLEKRLLSAPQAAQKRSPAAPLPARRSEPDKAPLPERTSGRETRDRPAERAQEKGGDADDEGATAAKERRVAEAATPSSAKPEPASPASLPAHTALVAGPPSEGARPSGSANLKDSTQKARSQDGSPHVHPALLDAVDLTDEESRIVDWMKEFSPRLQALDLELAAVVEQTVVRELPIAGASSLVLQIDKGFLFERKLRAPESIALLEKALEGGSDTKIEVRIELTSDYSPERTVRALFQKAHRMRERKLVLEVKNDPKVQAAILLLSAELKSIRLPEN